MTIWNYLTFFHDYLELSFTEVAFNEDWSLRISGGWYWEVDIRRLILGGWYWEVCIRKEALPIRWSKFSRAVEPNIAKTNFRKQCFFGFCCNQLYYRPVKNWLFLAGNPVRFAPKPLLLVGKLGDFPPNYVPIGIGCTIGAQWPHFQQSALNTPQSAHKPS